MSSESSCPFSREVSGETSRRPPGWLEAGVQHLSLEKRLRGLHLFILEKRSLQKGSYYGV